VAASVAGRGIMQGAARIWQPLLVMLAVLALVTYVPAVGLWLPKSMMGR
jgi:TRAP-type C4-dicarboxylate transport system permease large subunit